MTTEKSEPKTARLSLAVTEEEKDAARVVAALRGVSVSALLRTTPVDDVVAEYERVRGALEAA